MTPEDSIGITHHLSRMQLKHWLHRIIFTLVALRGLYMLYYTARESIVIYPQINHYFESQNFDQTIYMQLLQHAVLISIASFTETAVGLAMLVKKTHTIEIMHVVIGMIIFFLSYYLRQNGAILDFAQLEAIGSLPKFMLSG